MPVVSVTALPRNSVDLLNGPTYPSQQRQPCLSLTRGAQDNKAADQQQAFTVRPPPGRDGCADVKSIASTKASGSLLLRRTHCFYCSSLTRDLVEL